MMGREGCEMYPRSFGGFGYEARGGKKLIFEMSDYVELELELEWRRGLRLGNIRGLALVPTCSCSCSCDSR
jgi:hypothetical protein